MANNFPGHRKITLPDILIPFALLPPIQEPDDGKYRLFHDCREFYDAAKTGTFRMYQLNEEMDPQMFDYSLPGRAIGASSSRLLLFGPDRLTPGAFATLKPVLATWKIAE